MAEIKNYYLDLTGLKQYDQLIKEYINGKDLAIKGDLVVGDYQTIKALSNAIKTLEGTDHTHTNKGVLDGITATQVTSWDSAATYKHSHSNRKVLDNITAADVAAWDAAEANVQVDWNESNAESDAYIKNKPTDLVTHSRTIAGINLADDITKSELLKALNVSDGAEVNKIDAITVNGVKATITGKTATVTIPAATQDASGVMSKADKTKLDGIAEGAEVNYVKSVGDNLAVDTEGKLTVDIPAATKETAGLISKDDKTKLDGIEEGAEVNVIESISVNGVNATITGKAASVTISEATTSKSGVMSASDKSKLDGLANIKSVGDNLKVDNAGKLTVNIPSATVTGVKADDKVLSLNGTSLTSTISLSYDSGKKEIYLKGKDNTVISTVSAADFIKDGMISDVAWSAEKTNTLVITFNTEAGKEAIEVDFQKLVDTYTAGNGINVNGKVVSVKIANAAKDVVTLSADASGLSATLTGWDDVKKAVDALGTTYAPSTHTHSINDITDFAPIGSETIAGLFPTQSAQ